MSTIPLSLSLRLARITAVRDAVAALQFYTGLPPAWTEDATAEQLIATMALATPAGAISTDAPTNLAVFTATAPRTAIVTNGGLVGWVRAVDAAGNGLFDQLCVEAPAVGNVVLAKLQVYTGGELNLVSFVLTE